jgi:hypothetical protein
MVKLARNVAGKIRLPKLPTSRNVIGLPDQLGESTDRYTVEGYRHPYRIYQKTNELDPLSKLVFVLRDAKAQATDGILHELKARHADLISIPHDAKIVNHSHHWNAQRPKTSTYFRGDNRREIWVSRTTKRHPTPHVG